MAALESLPNIGKVLAGNLHKIGIDTAEALQEQTAEDVFLQLRAAGLDPCLHALTALAGAIAGIPKKALPMNEKEKLRQFYQQLKEL